MHEVTGNAVIDSGAGCGKRRHRAEEIINGERLGVKAFKLRKGARRGADRTRHVRRLEVGGQRSQSAA